MIWAILLAALAYCFYQYVILHFINKIDSFGWVDGFLILTGIIILFAMAFSVFRMIKSFRANKARREEEMKKYQEEMAVRQQRIYLEDDEKSAPVQAPEENDDDDWEPGDDLEPENSAE